MSVAILNSGLVQWSSTVWGWLSGNVAFPPSGGVYANIGLFKSPITIDPVNDTLATYTAVECTFPGYARNPWGDGGNLGVCDYLGNIVELGSQQAFAPGGPVVPIQTAYGFFVVISGSYWGIGDFAIAAGNLLTPKVFGGTGDVLSILINNWTGRLPAPF